MINILEKSEIKKLLNILHSKNINLNEKQVLDLLRKIIDSQEIFPQIYQLILLIQLVYEFKTKKEKQIILIDEIKNDKEFPIIITIGVLAQDWAGMSNSVLGIIHHGRRNIHFLKGFSLNIYKKKIGIVILAFEINNKDDYNKFKKEKSQLIVRIKDASIGGIDKLKLLDEETIKLEIYNNVVKEIKKICKKNVLNKIIGEDGEALKFFSTRSREYLEERDPKDLAELIIDNYKFQQLIKNNEANEVIKISNIKTKTEQLTGITFVCKEFLFSIEDFIKTLDYIIPEYIIKHHKSFVTSDGILVYRIEIVDKKGYPLKEEIIYNLEESIKKLIHLSKKKDITQYKEIGGYEHFARAIIPFLKQEMERTDTTQVFIFVEKRTDFFMNIKLITVSYKKRNSKILDIFDVIQNIKGIDILSMSPSKYYESNNKTIEINIIRLFVNLSEFNSIEEIFNKIKSKLRLIFKDIRDFDEGLRLYDFDKLNKLLEELEDIENSFIQEYYFNMDEITRINMNYEILKESIELCYDVVKRKENDKKNLDFICEHKKSKKNKKTIIIITFRKKDIFKKLVKKLKNVDFYLSNFFWNHSIYYIVIASKKNDYLDEAIINSLKQGCK